MTKRTENILWGIWAFLFFGFWAQAFFFHFKNTHEFKNQDIPKAKTTALVTKYQPMGRGYDQLVYEYYVNNKKIKMVYDIETNLRNRSKSDLRKFEGREFEVIYIIRNPKNSRLQIPKHILDGNIPEDW